MRRFIFVVALLAVWVLPCMGQQVFDWRNINGQDFMTPSKMQGPDECHVFAGCSVMEAKIKIVLNDPNFDIDLSERQLLTPYADNGFDLAKSTGILTEQDMPYDSANPQYPLDWHNRVYKITGYQTMYVTDEVAQRATIQQWLRDYGPLYVENVHACTLVGYDDTRSVWIVKETFGTEYGDNGYFDYSYNDFTGGQFRVTALTGDVYYGTQKLPVPPPVLRYWDPLDNGQGGAGTWNGSNLWDDSADGHGVQSAGTWDSAANDFVFGGSQGGLVSIAWTGTGTNRYARSIRFTTDGYNLVPSPPSGGKFYCNEITVDSGVSAQIKNLGTTSRFVKRGGGTLTYTSTGTLGSTDQTVLVDEGKLISYGMIYSSYDNPVVIHSGGTLEAHASYMLRTAASYLYASVEIDGGTYELHGYTQGNPASALLATMTIQGGQFLGGGGQLVMQSDPGYDRGCLTLSKGANFDMQDGTVSLFTSTNAHGFALSLSGGSTLATGWGKLILGQNSQADAGKAITISGTGGSSITGWVDLTNDKNSGARVRTITVADGAEAVDFTIGATVADGGQALSGITKAGTGTLVLGGNNIYTGPTNVTEGRLLVNGVTSGQGAFTVSPGATLGGTGTIGLANATTPVTVQGELAPGSSVGTLTIAGDLVLTSTSSCTIEIDDLLAGHFDTVKGTAAGGEDMTFGGTLNLVLDDFQGLGSVQLFDFDSYHGTFAQISVTNADGRVADFDANTGVLTVAAPEPATLALLGVAVPVLLRHRK